MPMSEFRGVDALQQWFLYFLKAVYTKLIKNNKLYTLDYKK